MCIWLMAPGAAFGFGGTFAGPVGSAVPTSSATQIVVASAPTGNTVTITAQVSTSLTDLALIVPAPGVDPATLVTLVPGQFTRLEVFTEPRVERLTCEELVDTYHWESAPGCASFDQERPVDLRGEDAVDAVSAAPSFSAEDLELQVITPAELEEWLAVRSLALDPAAAEALQPHLDAGEPLVTIHPARPVQLGEWLAPVRFIMAPGDWTIPLAIGSAAATAPHELIVYTLSDAVGGNSALANYPQGVVQGECVLAEGQDASEWLGAERDAVDADITVPAWVREYAGLADRCAPCTADPLIDAELSFLGRSADPIDTRIGRLWLRWDPGELFEDPVLVFTEPGSDSQLRFLEHDEGLTAIYQPCGATAPDPDAPFCENLRLPEPGCDHSGLAPLVPAVLVVAMVLRRSRAAALLILGGWLASGSAYAAPRDASPRTEAALGLSLIGTDRLVPTGLDRGAPWLLNPYLGVEVRRNLFAWRDGRTVGLLGAIRGFTGKAAPWGDRGVLSFTLLEPTVAVDVRHGRLREANPCWFGRYGADLALAIVDPSASSAHARLSGGLHAGFGLWLGRGTGRTSLELRGSAFPRTDGFETTYDPNLGLPGYLFLPGTANVWLLAGRAFY